MSHVTFIDPIATISGKIAKNHRTTYMVRRAATANANMLEYPCYTNCIGKRSTEPSESEKQARKRFANICINTQVRLKNPEYVDADQQAFLQQTTYKTLRQYVWHQVADAMT